MTIEEQLNQIVTLLGVLIDRESPREFYEIDEFARIVGRAPFTVREWARLGRISAVKRNSGRGASASWAVSHDEYRRYQREGLLPERHPQSASEERADLANPVRQDAGSQAMGSGHGDSGDADATFGGCGL